MPKDRRRKKDGSSNNGNRGNGDGISNRGGNNRGYERPPFVCNRKRGMFMKLMKDKDAELRNSFEAVRFVEGMATYECKAELLSVLDDERLLGSQRLRDVISLISSAHDVELILVPMLQILVNEETMRPLYQSLRNRILMILFRIPCFLDSLVDLGIANSCTCSLAASKTITCFLLCLTKAFVEARKSAPLRKLALQYKELGIGEAQIICSILMVDGVLEGPSQDVSGPSAAISNEELVCWVSDKALPGGRHSNDFLNFRDVAIVPTHDELLSTGRQAWLPLASGKNSYIADKEVRLLDSNFRLLREDAVHTMKQNILEPSRVWSNARIVELTCGTTSQGGAKKGGRLQSLSFVLQFDRRAQIVDWERSRALSMGSIVVLCEDGKPVRLGTIAVREHRKKGEWLLANGGPKLGVTFETTEDFNENLAEMGMNSHFNRKICNVDDEIMALRKNATAVKELKILSSKRESYMGKLKTYDLVEASQSFFTYQPILRSLQAMESVPFPDEIVHLSSYPGGRPSYLPAIVRMPNVDSFNGFKCNLDSSSSCLADMVENTSLDDSQAEAVYHALTSRVALIQGPPGTGKTFIGALLARMIRENSDESILCVCYTNHALDQFLEHLHDNGEDKIVRIGGRSKSGVIQKYQIRELSRTKAELDYLSTRRLRAVVAKLYEHNEGIQKLMEILNAPLGWKHPNGGAEAIILEEHPDFFEQLAKPEAGSGFQLVGKKSKSVKDDTIWKAWSQGEGCPHYLKEDPHNRDLLESYDRIWEMPKNDRIRFIEQLRMDTLSETRYALQEEVKRYQELHVEKQNILQEKDVQILRDARIVGATTTGAAQFRDILASKGAGVLIVEEAGEVFESHVLSALSKETKHVILIGDHKQLRPKAENYKLTCVSKHGYNLDCSLFERLVCSGSLPSTMLRVQHRMRPDISKMVRAQTYPDLKDHESVSKYPSIRGVSSNVVFIDHGVQEDSAKKRGRDIDNAKTKSNTHEAAVCVEIARFFLLQGYKPGQIVIITPYVGQLLKIVRTMKEKIAETTAYVSDLDRRDLEDDDAQELGDGDQNTDNENVRCASIDNFQGEEADIIIASLVRSNAEGNIGFLKEEQRVNVLMSRARMGLFIVGNSTCLNTSEKGAHVWQPLLQMLEEAGQVKNGLPTFCELHPDDEPIQLCQPCDFRKYRPNGGCSRMCTYRMSCGHVCPQACHPIDRSHKVAEKLCCEPCRRFPPECPLEHACTKLCKEKCGPCTTIVDAVALPCGHVYQSPRCHDVRNDDAKEKLSRRCEVIVNHCFPCGHDVLTMCSNARGAQSCPATCGRDMECGHQCKNLCGSCGNGHKCTKKCERTLFCGHECGRPCHISEDCEPCNRKCDVRCIHSKCSKLCHETCASCVEPCDWQCKHQGKCPLVCGAPCTRLPCNMRCTKTLLCGHRCPSLCGEHCPSEEFCQECCNDSKRNKEVEMIVFSTYGDLVLDEDPIIVLPCGHFFATSFLDGLMELHSVYKTGDNGEYVGIQTAPTIGGEIQKPKCCPDCRAVIHSVNRYGRVLHHADIRVLERKHLMGIDRRLKHLSRLGNPNPKKVHALITKMKEDGPMRRVYEACGGNTQVEAGRPDDRPLVLALLLLCDANQKNIKTFNDDYYTKSREACEEAIKITCTEGSKSHRSGCQAKIKLARLMITRDPYSKDRNQAIDKLLDWVINHEQKFNDLIEEANSLKKYEVPKDVMRAMHVIDNYDYGGSWSSHWFECPNGHPYFIGECGGAMETSKCPECREQVGGSSHRLLSSNRPSTFGNI